MKLRKGDAVRIRWLDSASSPGMDWTAEENTVKAVRCTTVGIVHEVTEEAVVLVMSRGNVYVCGLWAIPRRCILKTKKLRARR